MSDWRTAHLALLIVPTFFLLTTSKFKACSFSEIKHLEEPMPFFGLVCCDKFALFLCRFLLLFSHGQLLPVNAVPSPANLCVCVCVHLIEQL